MEKAPEEIWIDPQYPDVYWGTGKVEDRMIKYRRADLCDPEAITAVYEKWREYYNNPARQ